MRVYLQEIDQHIEIQRLDPEPPAAINVFVGLYSGRTAFFFTGRREKSGTPIYSCSTVGVAHA